MKEQQIVINGTTAQIRFHIFDLANYDLFLKCKKLPENQVTYDWETDTYTVTTPARYAGLLGVEIPATLRDSLPLAAHLFDYQRFIDEQALASKRYAVYADCGLGKTAIFLEFARQVIAATAGRVLIFSPLQVIQQTCDEATRFYGAGLQIIQLDSRAALEAWLKEAGPGLAITNYEKMIPGQIPDLRLLAGLILDESSLLKTGGGKIKWNLIKSAKGIEYKLSCTATPAPNDIMEYASQAAFLEKLRTEGEILWTFFSKVNKGRNKGKWVIKPHAREGFYRFLAGWSIYIRNPKVYGFADNLSQIPAPVFKEHDIDPTPEQLSEMNRIYFDAGAGLLGTQNIGVTQRIKLSQIAKGFLYQDKRKSVRHIPSRKAARVAEIARDEIRAGRQVLIWTVFDEEARLIEAALAELGIGLDVLDGSVKPGMRLKLIEDFRCGRSQGIISKAALLGFGMNFQFCTSMIFSGWDDSYERFYQAVRRAYRYGQTQTVHIHIPIIRHLEGLVMENVLRKKTNFERDADEQEKYYLEALKGLIPA
jgi:helicase-like protein/RAD3-like DEAD/DEAH box helicase